jgi:hypothetical protein
MSWGIKYWFPSNFLKNISEKKINIRVFSTMSKHVSRKPKRISLDVVYERKHG